MKASSNRPAGNNRRSLLAIAAIVLAPLLLAGCARPGDADMNNLLNVAMECKWVEVDEFKKTDSLPGLWSYVGQYSFQLKMKDGETGTRNFYSGMFAVMPANEKNLKKALQSQQVQDYMGNECSDGARAVLYQAANHVLNQLDDKEPQARLPVILPMTGWAEFANTRKGWVMDVRREKINGAFVYAEPMKWDQVSPKAGAIFRQPETKQ